MLRGLSRYVPLLLGSVVNTPGIAEVIAWQPRILTLSQLSQMVTNLVEMREDGSDTASTEDPDRSPPRSSSAATSDLPVPIPPRGLMREAAVRSLTMSTAVPNNHPVLEMLNQVLQSSEASGHLVGPLEGVSSYRLELVVQLSAEDGDALFGELLGGRGAWLNRDGQLERWVAPEDRIEF
jgi:hypothetical protein